MSPIRNGLIFIWCLICGAPFFFIASSFQRYHDGSHKYHASFLIGLVFYLIAVPPIIMMERGAGIKKYILLKLISIFTLYLLVRFFMGEILPFWTVAVFMIFYIGIGFFALLSVWFFIVAMKCKEISLAGRIYAYINLVVVNGGGLAILFFSG